MKKSKFWFVRKHEKQKKLFNYVRLIGKYAFFNAKFILAILLAMLISRKPVQRRGICEKCGFSAGGSHQRVKKKLPICFKLAFFLTKK